MFTDRISARKVVVEFLGRGYGNFFRDDLIGTPSQGPFGCVLQYQDCGLANSRWQEAGFVVGRILRQKYPNGKTAWNAQNWSLEIDPILDLIAVGAARCAALPLPSLDETEPSYVPGTEPQSSGFVPWRLFRKRSPVPSQGGVYVFAHFSGLPEPVVDLMSRAVIYIGYIGHDKNRRSLNQRLIEFQQTAHGLLGHSGAWTYRTEFVPDWASLQLFRNTYVSWRVFQPGERPTANQFEQDQIKRYSQKWGKRPFVNRRD